LREEYSASGPNVSSPVQILQVMHNLRASQNQRLTACEYQVQNDKIGYARVSTDGQTLDAQQSALQSAGAERVFAEKQSGAKTDRQQLRKALAALGAGDTLVVCKLDRLARSTRDLLNTLAAVADAGATFKSLGDPWCNTTTPHGKLMLTVLGGLAEFERHLILARTGEGRRRAQQRGVKFGRKPSLTPHQQQEALARRAAGEALVDIARSYAVSHSTISRLGAGV
jgi:DNA invertase Pin-like site-specific DNA recombinase